MIFTFWPSPTSSWASAAPTRPPPPPGATPPRPNDAEPLAVRHDLTKLAIVCDGIRPALAERQRLVVERALYLLQKRMYTLGHPCHGDRFLGLAVRARHEGYLLVLGIAGADLDAHGHAAQLPVVELEPRALLAPVRTYRPARRPQRALDLADQRRHRHALFLRAEDGHDDGLDGRDTGRHTQAGGIAVGHDDAAHHARAGAPAGRPGHLHLAVGILETDVEAAREILPEVVRGRRLQRLAVAHHGLDGICAQRAGELLALGLEAGDAGHRQLFHEEVLIDVVQDQQRLGLGLILGAVHRVALLPEKLGGAQEGPRALLPAHDVAPLVVEHGQVAVALDPARVGVHD